MIPRFVSRYFPADVRARGAPYATDGSVHLFHASAAEFHAEVRGTRTYAVAAHRDGTRLLLSCSCPYAVDHGACKHLWATLTVADGVEELKLLLG